MEAGLQKGSRGSALLVVAALLILARAAPLQRAYLEKLLALHGRGVVALAAAGALVALALLWVGLWKRPRVAGIVLASLALLMTLLSGNLAALLAAGLLLAGVFLLGDLLFRWLVGADAAEGDVATAFACGLAGAGLIVLLLGEAGWLGRTSLALGAAVVLAARRRRVPDLVRLARGAVRLPRGGAHPALESAWLALAALFLLAVWAGVCSPDLSWDALAYHLPEARDIARAGFVRPLPDLEPQSLLWRNHDAALALGFFFGGERVVQFLQFATGVAVFPAALTLARRLGASGASALVVLSLAGFPTAMLQLKSAYVDWPAALLVTAAAAQLAAPASAGRFRAAGYLLGAAVATKVFAVFAVPAFVILLWRARPSPRAVAGAVLCALLALAPWLAWSGRRAGSITAPYARSPRDLVEQLVAGRYFTTSPASGATRVRADPVRSAASFLRLPYDLVFHSSRFEANGDGYNGALVLLLVVGIAGWTRSRVGLFLAAALPFLVPWSLLYAPSVRFLFPVYPLFAVFASEGLFRLTRGFAGVAGTAAGLAVLGMAAAFPVQFGSTGLEAKVALGRISREDALAAALPAYPLWREVGPADRVVFLGEFDRFHCPAASAWRSEFRPVSSWGEDPVAWKRGLDALSATHVLWRSDRRPDGGPIPWLADRLESVAENRSAILYRIVLQEPESKK